MLRNMLFAIVALAATSAYAAAPMIVRYETPIETTASVTSPPTQVPDTMIARGCAACASVVLHVTTDTKFFINKEQVDLAELRRQAVGDLFMGIYYLEETKVVTRIVLVRR